MIGNTCCMWWHYTRYLNPFASTRITNRDFGGVAYAFYEGMKWFATIGHLFDKPDWQLIQQLEGIHFNVKPTKILARTRCDYSKAIIILLN